MQAVEEMCVITFWSIYAFIEGFFQLIKKLKGNLDFYIFAGSLIDWRSNKS